MKSALESKDTCVEIFINEYSKYCVYFDVNNFKVTTRSRNKIHADMNCVRGCKIVPGVSISCRIYKMCVCVS